MDFFNRMVEQFIRANRRLKKWHRAVSVMAAIVVFATTYALVLPAITLDKETASTQAGIEIAASDNEADSGGTVYEPGSGEEPQEDSEEPDENDSGESQEAGTVTEDSGSHGGSREAEVSEEDDSGRESDGGQNTDEQADSEEAEDSADRTDNASDTTGDAVAALTAETPAESETDEESGLITEKTLLTYEYIDEDYEDGIDDENDDGIDDGYFVYAEFGAEAKLPKGVELKAEEITKESDPETYEAYYEKALSGLQDKYDENTALSFARFYDIKFVYNGEEVEPSGDVKVRIEYKKAVEIKKETNVDAVHFDKNNDEEPEVIESEVNKPESGLLEDSKSEAGAEEKGKDDTVKTVEFESAQFSVYGIIGSYTVDFHWEVNGKTYDFSIPGGGFVSFEHLVEVLGIGESDTDGAFDDSGKSESASAEDEAVERNENEVSEAIRDFVADVESVEFSNPELVWVGKTDEDTTVGGLKEANGLEVEYSADLTEEQIAEINAQTVDAGDWALISVQPFISAETLTVTMKNGEVFTINITDAQMRTRYLSDNGDLYEVTVYYGDEAKIPADAELKVTPYEEESDEYNAVRDIVLKQTETDQADKIRALDISIEGADGQLIEPEAPVRVEMVIKNLKEELYFAEDSMSVLHLDASSGDVKVETVADAGDKGNIQLDEENATASFTLSSFSQFAVTYGNYVRVNVHYVDVNGNELTGSTRGVSVYNGSGLVLGDYANRMNQSGYTYLGAHYGVYSGQTVTSLRATNSPTEGSLKNSGQSVTFYNGTNIVARQEYESRLRQVDVYLVYAPSTGYYITDTIGKDGCLTVQNGTSVIETGTDQNLFVRWYRSDNGTTGFQEVTQSKILDGNYNIPVLGGPKVNVSIDEGADRYYKAEIYKVENNEEIVLAQTGVYHVPYYDDVRNGGFETPQNDGTINSDSAHKWPSNYQVKNGEDGVIWKTTGSIADGRDIEIPNGANANGPVPGYIGETLRNYCFAYMPEGDQCAELNCEAAGALYQDVLTVPGSQIYWSLYHRARGAYDKWKTVRDKTQNSETDTMYVVAMPTELAEKYDVTTQEKVLQVLNHVNDPGSEFHDCEIVRITTTNKGDGTITFMNDNVSLTVPPTYFGNLADGQTATAYDGGTNLTFTYGNTDWHYYTGNFSIPGNQYLTRFFFVAGPTASGDNTMGNFLDDIRLSDSVPTPNHGQATAIVKKTVEGLDTLPEDYATRIETTYNVTSYSGITASINKDSDYDLYRTEIDESGKSVSTASWTFPISIENGDRIVFTKGEETTPANTSKTDVVEGYSQSTSYTIRKQSDGQTSPAVIAQGTGKEIPEEEIRELTVNEKDIIYIEFTNTYKPKHKVSVRKTDPAGNVIRTGASFELYKADDFDDTAQKPKQDAEVIASGTTGENGILYLEELAEGEYRLVETDAPDGYILLDSAVKIFITESTVTAMSGNSNLTVAVKGDEDWVEGQLDDTHQISVWNNPGVELPATGGPGTKPFMILGTILITGAGMLLWRRRKLL